MDYYLSILYQLPDFAQYLLLLPDDAVQCLYHVIMVGACLWHKMNDDYYLAIRYEIHKTHATYY